MVAVSLLELRLAAVVSTRPPPFSSHCLFGNTSLPCYVDPVSCLHWPTTAGQKPSTRGQTQHPRGTERLLSAPLTNQESVVRLWGTISFTFRLSLNLWARSSGIRESRVNGFSSAIKSWGLSHGAGLPRVRKTIPGEGELTC